MPMDRTLYPDDWDAIAFRIKTAANWTCQQCERPCRQPGETVDELAVRLAELDPNAVTWLADLYVDRHRPRHRRAYRDRQTPALHPHRRPPRPPPRQLPPQQPQSPVCSLPLPLRPLPNGSQTTTAGRTGRTTAP
jgi:hypothetical protein